MKKQPIIWLFFMAILHFHAVQAQKAPISYGKLSEEEIKMNQYDPDPSAPAVILCDYGNTYFTYESGRGYVQIFERIKRIKIFKKEGYHYADVEIPYYQNSWGKEIVSELKAHVYNMENGKMTEIKMGKDGVFDQKIDTRRHSKKFSIPQVKEGSIIEYSYETSSDFFSTLPNWVFQHNVPTLHSEYRLSLPYFMTFAKIAQGTVPFAVEEAKQNNVNFIVETEVVNTVVTDYRWVQKNIPKIDEEPFIGTTDNYLSRIDFQLKQMAVPGRMIHDYTNTWEKLSTELWDYDDFGGVLDSKRSIEKLAEPLVSSLKDEKDKMKAIYNYVITNFKSNDHYWDIIMFQPMSDLLDSKNGYPSEINLLLIAMLKSAGLNASPVILSTRSHGKINPLYPFMEKFNHTIACVQFGEERMLLDACDPLRPPGLLPEEAMNGEGILLVSKGSYELIPIENSIKSTYYVNANISVLPDGMLEEKIQFNFKGVPALEERQALKSESFEKRLPALLKEELEDGKLIDSKSDHLKEIDQTLVYDCTLQSKAFVQVNEPNIYLTPLLNFGITENPLKSETRKYPVDFGYGQDKICIFTINIPEGYTIAEAPKPVRLQWEDGAMKFDFIVDANEKQIKISDKIVVKKAYFNTDEYAQLREFFTAVAQKHAEQLVLVKKP